MLTELEVVPYLLHRGLLHAADVVAGDVQVASSARRNSNFVVRSRRGPAYVLKQGLGAARSATIEHEAAIYAGLCCRAGLARHLPRYHGYDPERHILSLELVGDGRTLREHAARRAGCPPALAARLGEALAHLHSQSPAGVDAPPSRAPWVLEIHRPDLAFYRELSAANLRVIEIVQQYADFGRLLDALRAGWRASCLIHGDLKWDNVLVATGPSGRHVPRPVLVDWEMAALGDPAWDVGVLLGEFLAFWLLSIPLTGETPPERATELARYPLAELRPALRAFWAAYRQARAPCAAGDELERAVRYGAAWLLQTAIERTQLAIQVPGALIVMLQLSLNLLQDPRNAADQLLGLPIDPGSAT
jgi:hypothetical protein